MIVNANSLEHLKTLDEEYCKLSEARIDAWEQEETPEQLRLA